MTSFTIPTKQVRDVVNATFPSYKRHNVRVVPSKGVTLSDLNWSGGTRSEYRAYDLDTGKGHVSTNDFSRPAPWNNPFEGLSFELPKNVIIVRGGHFCGKTAMLALYVHPDNLPKLIAEHGPYVAYEPA